LYKFNKRIIYSNKNYITIRIRIIIINRFNISRSITRKSSIIRCMSNTREWCGCYRRWRGYYRGWCGYYRGWCGYYRDGVVCPLEGGEVVGPLEGESEEPLGAVVGLGSSS
jgi:hypothetical protein